MTSLAKRLLQTKEENMAEEREPSPLAGRMPKGTTPETQSTQVMTMAKNAGAMDAEGRRAARARGAKKTADRPLDDLQLIMLQRIMNQNTPQGPVVLPQKTGGK